MKPEGEFWQAAIHFVCLEIYTASFSASPTDVREIIKKIRATPLRLTFRCFHKAVVAFAPASYKQVLQCDTIRLRVRKTEPRRRGSSRM